MMPRPVMEPHNVHQKKDTRLRLMSSVQSLYHVLFGFVRQCAGEHRSTVR